MPGKTQEEKLALTAKRAHIIRLYNADGDWRRLATQLNVPKTTAYRWPKEGVKDNGRGGSYNQRITSEQMEAMCNFIENNLRIPLAQIVNLKYGLVGYETIIRNIA